MTEAPLPDLVDVAEIQRRLSSIFPEGSPNRSYCTREPIRDETLREGLVAVGAATLRPDLATTSSKPRYALRADFAALFAPGLSDSALAGAIARWQEHHPRKSS